MRTLTCVAVLAVGLCGSIAARQRQPLQPADFYALQSVGDVQLSPGGEHLAYAVTSNRDPGRPGSSTWLREMATGQTVQLDEGSGPRWSPDGQRIAYFGRTSDGSGLVVADARGRNARLVAPVSGTNHPLPSSGERVTWSPDGRFLAFLSSTPGPESDEAQGDPMVITRYLFKPTASEGLTRFNDNRRLHIFIADIATRAIRQLTDGDYYEHSIAWSPDGRRILFVSNRGPNPDKVFNYDLFTVTVADGAITRLTDTRSAEYFPSWSPDGSRIAFSGTTRDLTSSETTMEDTHAWVMQADGSGRVELGASIDNRQGPPHWSPDGRRLYVTVQERGHVRLTALDATAGSTGAAVPVPVIAAAGSVGSYSVGRTHLAYAFTTPAAPAELYVMPLDGPSPSAAGGRTAAPPGTALTTLNQPLLSDRQLGEVEPLTFVNDGHTVEAFLTRPVGPPPTAAGSVPMIVMIHGGPHGQQGPGFNAKAQVYAGLGWATLMVNYRGSTGYGQVFTDAIFQDQNGAEARDVIAGVEAALSAHPWIDGNRLGIEGGSYGGQLTNWIITQTPRFKAAVPSAGISNLVTQNYLAYYHDYLAVEYGGFPHERARRDPQERLIIDMLWERSPIRQANRVKTPVLFIHGEHDNDVPIEEAEQFYIALHDVGVPTVLVRYPREGHGLRETKHVVDALERSVGWYREYFR